MALFARSATLRPGWLGAACVALVAGATLAGSVAPATGVSAPTPTVQAAKSAAVKSIAMTSHARTLNWPAKVHLSGTATRPDGSRAKNVTIQLWAKQVHTPDYRVAVFKTNANGRVFATRLPQKQTTYRWRVPNDPVRSASRVVKVRPAVTIRGSSHQVRLSSKLVISGGSSPTRRHTPIRLQKKTAHGWSTVAHARFAQAVMTAKPSAPYRFAVGSNRAGAVSYRVVVPQDDGRLQRVSKVLRARFVTG